MAHGGSGANSFKVGAIDFTAGSLGKYIFKNIKNKYHI